MDVIQSIIAVAATLLGLATATILQDFPGRAMETTLATTSDGSHIFKTRGLEIPPSVRMPATSPRAGHPAR
jgi:hypothetical protein